MISISFCEQLFQKTNIFNKSKSKTVEEISWILLFHFRVFGHVDKEFLTYVTLPFKIDEIKLERLWNTNYILF